MVVGTEGDTKTWHLPKELLVNASPFFSAALNGSFAEATSRTVSLPEENTDAFALFIRWLYVGEICGNMVGSEDQATGDETLETGSDPSIDSTSYARTKIYLKAYILGDKLGCLIFLDLAMLELIKDHKSDVLRAETMRVVFEQSAPGSKLRQFAIDQFRFELVRGRLWEGAAAFVAAAKIAEDFALDFLKVCVEAAGGDAIDPQTHKGRYMEVLQVTEED